MKKVFRNSSECIHIFAQQSQSEGKCCNVFFDEKVLYSYGYHYKLAEFISPHDVLISTYPYSVTTSKHINETRQALFHKNRIYIHLINDGFDGNFKHYENAIKYNLSQASKAITYKVYYLTQARAEYEEFIRYCSYMYKTGKKRELNSLKKLVEKIDLSVYKNEILKQRKEAKERAIFLEKEKIETIEKWKNGENVSIPYGINTVFLRLKNGFIETSKNARVTLEQAKILYALISSGKDINGHKIDDYTVISYNNDILKIGCHNITKNEIDRISSLLK